MTDFGEIATNPAERRQGAAEVLDWFVDFSAYDWSPGEVATACAAILTERMTGQAYAAGVGTGPLAPAFTGKIVTVWLQGLVAGHDYLLRTTLTTNQDRTHEALTLYRCVA